MSELGEIFTVMGSQVGSLEDLLKRYQDLESKVKVTTLIIGSLSVRTRAQAIFSWRNFLLLKGEFNRGRNDIIHVKHTNRNTYLTTNRSYQFNQNNCGYQCPIMGQLEVNAYS
jgi:hypothetical protein